MKQFMVEIKLGRVTEEFHLLIPEQRKAINRLFEERIILSYALANDFSRLWIVMLGKDEEQVTCVLETFPLIQYMRYNIFPLLFHNMISNGLPSISLN